MNTMVGPAFAEGDARTGSARAACGSALAVAGLGALACLGAGLGRSDGLEPWLVNGAALGLTMVGLALGGAGPRRMVSALARLGAKQAGPAERSIALAAAAVALAVSHAAIWLPFGLRFWPLGLTAGFAAAASVLFLGLAFARHREAPRWSGAPTPLLFLALGGAGGLLTLSAAENLLGFPPGLVVWKAALAIIGLGLAAQLWTAQAAEAAKAAAAEGRVVGPLIVGPAHDAVRERARAYGYGALGLGIAVPILCAIAADFLSGGFWMPVALAAHLAGACLHRRLFLAGEERVRPAAAAQ